MVPVGEWNICEFVTGVPGCGKTTYMARRIRDEMRRGPRYVIAHDPGLQLQGDDLQRHSDEAALFRALSDPKRTRGIHCLQVGDAMRVVAAAEQVAAASRAAGANGRAVPVLVYFDEACALRNMSPSYLDPEVQEVVLMRRSRHIGFLFGTQRLQVLHPTLLDAHTRVIVFRMVAARQLKRLDELGVPPATIRRVQTLRPHEHLVYSQYDAIAA
jgi:hypothetical protein